MNVLNPSLYNRLNLLFRNVKVVNRGVKMIVRNGTIERWGESYAVSCPFCSDRKNHLYISHMYLREIPGMSTFSLWKCFRNECQSDYENRRTLFQIVTQKLEGFELKDRYDTPEQKSTYLPGTLELIHLHSLPSTHPAIDYLLQRNFDPLEIENLWKVVFCPHHTSISGRVNLTGRLIIPIIEGGKIQGIQARSIFPSQNPRYLSLFRKSKYLYGYDKASEIPDLEYLVIVEGVTDVWRWGPGAVCLFGKDASLEQIEKILSLIKTKKPKRVFGLADGDDPQSFGKFSQLCKKLNSLLLDSICTAVCCPQGKDPAELTRSEIRELFDKQEKGNENSTEHTNSRV